MKRLLLLLVCLPLLLRAAADNGPERGHPGVYFMTDARAAQELARTEGKLYFIEFYAHWCLPCRWMAESTFRDPEVLEAIGQYYIPVRADIDKAEGFPLFSEHQVTVLPTFLILDAEGRVLAREEESLTIVQMLDLLRTQAAGINPRAPRNIAEAPAYNDILPADKAAAPVVTAETDKVRVAPALPEATLPDRGYTVQVGVYTLYANVLTRSEEIRTLGDHPVFTETRSVETSTIYKVLSGHFDTRQEAEAWRATLAAAQIPGYIRDLRQ